MKTLLILSTDEPTLSELQQQLKDVPYNLHILADPDIFFEAFKSLGPDLVVLDFLLSEKNGGSICHQLKTSPATQDLPVIMLSESEEQPERFGCDVLLRKPADLSELKAHIDNLLTTDIQQS